LFAAVALLPVSCSSGNTITIQGGGATFPAPLYKRWFLEFYRQHPDVRVNYQAIGSGAGVHQLEEGLFDFAATDEALKEARLLDIGKKLGEREHGEVELIQFPLTAGGVALCYNLPGNPHLKLTREAYMGILLGDIVWWDDPAIQSANESGLPHLRIVFVRRAESSGTTFVFTTHLSAIDERWKHGEGLGAAKSVQWRVGIGGKGNSGVAALIQQTPGAFGYIEAGYAELVGLPAAAVENKKGNFVQPTEASCAIALKEAKFDKVLGTTVPDPEGEDAYPIVTFTWVVCRTHYADKRVATELKAVFEYCLGTGTGGGQDLSSSLGYAPMPPEALEKSRAKLKLIDADRETTP
jgi:phosphate transport system substrate-binding protein